MTILTPAFGASRLAGAGRGREPGAPLYRQCRGHDRDGVVDPGLRPGRGHLVQEDRRRLREGQRQHDRLHIMPYAPMRQKIVSAMTERRRPGPVPEHPGRDHCALCLGRQAGRCHRRRRNAKVAIHRDRAAHGLLLQQRREEAQLLRRALYSRVPTEPYLAATGREGRLHDGGPAEDLGCLLRFLQGGAEEIARPGRCAMSMASVSS